MTGWDCPSPGYYRRVRIARRLLRCDECYGPISPGDRYLEAVAAPWHDFNPRGRGYWTRHHLCNRHPVFWPKENVA